MQADVAREAGITRAMLSSYENERKRPTLASLERILDALHAGPVELDQAMQLIRGAPARAALGLQDRELLAQFVESLIGVLEEVVLPALRAPSEAAEARDGTSD